MRRNLVMLVALALLWGASFMFIKIADRHLAPATLILGRLGLGALTLALIVPFTVGWRGTVAAPRENRRWLRVGGLPDTALPAGVVQAPHSWPGWRPVASVVVLGVPLLGFAYLLFFALITGPGAAYASLVTYLIPPIALAYGSIFLGEHFGALAFGGLALILGGVSLGTGSIALASLRAGRAESREDS